LGAVDGEAGGTDSGERSRSVNAVLVSAQGFGERLAAAAGAVRGGGRSSEAAVEPGVDAVEHEGGLVAGLREGKRPGAAGLRPVVWRGII
jgi:hypothetical protein